MSNDLAWANDELLRRRQQVGAQRRQQPQAVSAVVQSMAAGDTSSSAPPVPAVPPRIFEYKALEKLTTNHLHNAAQRQRLQAAIDGAQRWRAAWPESAGLSFVITGAVGTGKTTIALQLRDVAQTRWVAVDHDGEPIPDTDVVQFAGRFVTATQLMGMMDPGRRASEVEGWGEVGRAPLHQLLQNVRVLAVDDAGTEELAFVAKDAQEGVRQNRYREVFDFCYRHGISLVITSNVPLLAGDGKSINPEFVRILGAAAFDRLWQMARGYTFDLSGLPSYRQYTR